MYAPPPPFVKLNSQPRSSMTIRVHRRGGDTLDVGSRCRAPEAGWHGAGVDIGNHANRQSGFRPGEFASSPWYNSPVLMARL